MGTKKIAFQVTIDVPQATVKDLVGQLEEYMMDDFDVAVKLGDDPRVLALIEKGVKKNLAYGLDMMYADETIDMGALHKLFKKEIAAAETEREAKEAAEREAREALRVKTAGVLRMNPEQIKEAQKLLKAAGIEATV